MELRDIAFVSIGKVTHFNALEIDGIGWDVGVILHNKLCTFDNNGDLIIRCNVLEKDMKTGRYDLTNVELNEIYVVSYRRLWPEDHTHISFPTARKKIIEEHIKISEQGGYIENNYHEKQKIKKGLRRL